MLLHAGERILPEVAESLAVFAQGILVKRGVEIRFKTRLEAATSDAAVLRGGERIPTKHPRLDRALLPASAAGSAAPGQRARTTACSPTGTSRRKDGRTCGHSATARSCPRSTARPSPPTAQHAIRQAAVAAHNIVATLHGRTLRTFDFKGLGKMGALGHRSAVAELPFGIKISGFPAWFIWRTHLPQRSCRAGGGGCAWPRPGPSTCSCPPELVQLKLGGSGGVTQEHFEPGQDVFRQGDLGDRVYSS